MPSGISWQVFVSGMVGAMTGTRVSKFFLKIFENIELNFVQNAQHKK